MKQVMIKLIALVAAAATLFAFFALTLNADYVAWKAFNIYSDPDTSQTSGRFTTYSIDFLSDDTADCTYWALANFGLYKSKATQKKYKNISGGGAYAGLQDGAYAKHWDGSYFRNEDGTLYFGKVGILSFWEMTYYDKIEKKNVIMRASRVYPEGESTFGGEGEGTNCIMPYAWQDSRWYRMILHSWDDAETGTTFVGEWYQDLETGEWTLFAYFDTHLYESCIEGGMGLFMENFSTSTKDDVRTFKTKNIYAQDAADGLWKSLPTCKMSYGDGGTPDKVGGHDFGAADDYFWGTAGGVVENQASYDASSRKSGTYTINQPDQPTLSAPKEPTLKAEQKGKNLNVSWTADPTGAPQQSYTLSVFANGEKVFETTQTRPEVDACKVEDFSAKEYKCVLTVNDIFGGTTITEYATAGYTDEPLPQAGLESAPFTPGEFVVWAVLFDKKEN